MPKDIAIISPDPETSRLLTLKLEIDSLSPISYVSCQEFIEDNSNDMTLAVFDMVDASIESTAEINMLAKFTKKANKLRTVVILPRGSAGFSLKRADWVPTIEVKRPFELGHLVEIIKSEMERKTPVQKKVRTGAKKAKKKTTKPLDSRLRGNDEHKKPSSPKRSSSSRKNPRR